MQRALWTVLVSALLLGSATSTARPIVAAQPIVSLEARFRDVSTRDLTLKGRLWDTTQAATIAAFDPHRRCFGRRGTTRGGLPFLGFSREGVLASYTSLVGLTRFGFTRGSTVEQFQQAFVRHDACAEHRPFGSGKTRTDCDLDLATDLHVLCWHVAKQSARRQCAGLEAFLSGIVHRQGGRSDATSLLPSGKGEAPVNCDAIAEYGAPRDRVQVVALAGGSTVVELHKTSATRLDLIKLDPHTLVRGQPRGLDVKNIRLQNFEGRPWALRDGATLHDLHVVARDLLVFPPAIADLDGDGAPELWLTVRKPRRSANFVGPLMVRYDLERNVATAHVIAMACQVQGHKKDCRDAQAGASAVQGLSLDDAGPDSEANAVAPFEQPPLVVHRASKPDVAGRDMLVFAGLSIDTDPQDLDDIGLAGVYWLRTIEVVSHTLGTNTPALTLNLRRYAVQSHPRPPGYEGGHRDRETYRRFSYSPMVVGGENGDRIALLYRDTRGFHRRGFVDTLAFGLTSTGSVGEDSMALAHAPTSKQTSPLRATGCEIQGLEVPILALDGRAPSMCPRVYDTNSHLREIHLESQRRLPTWPIVDYPLLPLPHANAGPGLFVAISLARCTDACQGEQLRLAVVDVAGDAPPRVFHTSPAKGEPVREYGSVVGDYLRYPAFTGRFGPRASPGIALIAPTTHPQTLTPAERKAGVMLLPRTETDLATHVRVLEIFQTDEYRDGDWLATEWICPVPEEWQKGLRLARAAWITTSSTTASGAPGPNAILATSRDGGNPMAFAYLKFARGDGAMAVTRTGGREAERRTTCSPQDASAWRVTAQNNRHTGMPKPNNG
jgi:hypothetical protein